MLVYQRVELEGLYAPLFPFLVHVLPEVGLQIKLPAGRIKETTHIMAPKKIEELESCKINGNVRILKWRYVMTI